MILLSVFVPSQFMINLPQISWEVTYSKGSVSEFLQFLPEVQTGSLSEQNNFNHSVKMFPPPINSYTDV